MSEAQRIPQDLALDFWTVNQAALHLGCERQTIRKYIREGLPLYEHDLVKPAEVIAEKVRRYQRHHSTRL